MESQEEKETKKTWLKIVGSMLGVIIIIFLIFLGVYVAVLMFGFNVDGGIRLAGTEETAKTEMAVVQTALLEGMSDNSVTSVTAGAVIPNNNNKTVYYPGGSFTLETYIHLPPHGEWHWATDGMIDKGCYDGGGKCCAYFEGSWTCTDGLNCSSGNCACS